MSFIFPEEVRKPFAVIGSEGLWKRLGVGVLGGALIIIGIVLLVSGTQAIKDAASLAVGVASKGIVK